ncbi:hypothetical protein RCG17_00730 [Neobacillus sp. PS3-12]|nr:hypothetical protein [Neobacillus sp. PS3-12]WML53272.1 hypothetical protein RCG17_00730 [Neobacillus sp. PS3-12]
MTSQSIKRLILGRPLKSEEAEAEKMQLWKALPILSSDALSSVAYGTEMILLELATVGAFAFSFSIPIAIAFSPEEAKKMEERWEQWNPGVRLVVVVSRYRTLIKPLVEFIGRVERRYGKEKRITVLLPEFITHKFWHRLLHNQSAFRIRTLLLNRKDVVVSSVPFHLND